MKQQMICHLFCNFMNSELVLDELKTLSIVWPIAWCALLPEGGKSFSSGPFVLSDLLLSSKL